MYWVVPHLGHLAAGQRRPKMSPVRFVMLRLSVVRIWEIGTKLVRWKMSEAHKLGQ